MTGSLAELSWGMYRVTTAVVVNMRVG